MQDDVQHYEVIIVGCGPVGAVSANILGQHGIKTLIIEREISEHGQPRAFSCDDEAMRIYQYLGLDEQLRSQMHSDRYVEYTGVGGRRFAEILLEEVDFGYGFRPLYFFHQSDLEATLRKGFQRYESVTFLPGRELVTLHQNDEGVTLNVRNAYTGETYSVTADYVLGCDGGRSTVRKLLGIGLAGIHYEEPWLAVSGSVKNHSAKLDHIRFVCNPERPIFVGPAPSNQFRMEFKLLPDETASAMEDSAKVRELISPYVDPDQFEIERAAVYTFHNAVANQWRQGRVFLLGDAAHMMPPFMGQGLVSGLRDAMNLGWKLTLALRGANPAVLDSYEQERRPHVRAMADISVKMGHIFLTRQLWLGRVRDSFFRFVQRIPAGRDFITHMKFKPKPYYPEGLFEQGKQHKAAGTYFPQPQVMSSDGRMQRLDDLIGNGFAVISRANSPQVRDGDFWTRLGTRFLQLDVDIADPSGTLQRWFEAHKAEVVVVRPDRFVFAAGTHADMQRFEAALSTYFANVDFAAVRSETRVLA